jgi:hypothetical protein
MRILRITNGFERLTDAALEARANSILAALTGNTAFPTPVPSLPALQTAIDDYTDALARAQQGSAYEKAFKNQKKMVLIDLLHSLGNYVLFTANGDELMAKSSGFAIAKLPSPKPPVEPAGGQVLSDGPNAGELDYKFKPVKGARSYLYQHTPEPLTAGSVWESQAGTVSRVRFSGLESGKRYWCRVMTVGTGGQAVYSEPVSRVVQ